MQPRGSSEVLPLDGAMNNGGRVNAGSPAPAAVNVTSPSIYDRNTQVHGVSASGASVGQSAEASYDVNDNQPTHSGHQPTLQVSTLVTAHFFI